MHAFSRVGRLLFVAIFFASAVQAAAPVIVNRSHPGQWLETLSLSRQNPRAVVTFVVTHDPGVSITGLAVDSNYDGADSTAFAPLTVVGAQRMFGSFNQSRVTAVLALPAPGGFSCSVFTGGTRRRSVPLRIAAVDSTGLRSGSVTGFVHFVDATSCSGTDDYPHVFSQSQNTTLAVPGQTVTFSFAAEDPDSGIFSSEDDADAIEWRVRNLMDAAILSTGLRTGMNDHTMTNLSLTMPRRGRIVVEGRVRNENGNFPDPAAWWRLGAVDVNSSASSIQLSLHPTAQSVNAGQPLVVNANVADFGDSGAGGRVQVIEWDATNDGGFERREFTNETQPVFGAMLQQSVDTSTHGTKVITARATDNGAVSAADHIRRSVTTSTTVRVNAIPVANSQSVATSEDAPKAITLSATDADNAPMALRFDLLSLPRNGSLSCSASGPFCTYTPSANFNGADSFTFRAADGPAGSAWSVSNVATVSIIVTPVNDAPQIANRAFSVNENTPLSFHLTATDVDNDPLTFTTTAPSHGTLICSPVGACTYTPEADYSGADSFTYTGSDRVATTSPATVSITIASVNSVPVAADLAISTDEDAAVTFTLPATDVDSAILTIAAGNAGNGSVACENEVCTYTPNADFHGTDTFPYVATDSDGASDEGTVTITVAPVNDAPVTASVEVSTDEDTPVEFNVAASDLDGDPLTFTPAAAGHGSVICSGPTCTYTPDQNYFGGDTLVIVVDDGNGGSTSSDVSVTVNAVNDAPIADEASIQTAEDLAVTFVVPASDAESAAITLVAGEPAHGTVSCGAESCTYQPNANFFGEDSLTYTATDADGASDSGTITILVTPVNDPPVTEDVDAGTDEDTAIGISIPSADVDDAELSYTVTTPPAHGSVSCEFANCVYEPDANYFGSDSFRVSVADDESSALSNVSVTIAPVNDAPVIEDLTIGTDEDAAVSFTPPVSDVDSESISIAASDPEHGSVSCAATCTYTPDGNFFGTDSFTLTASDGRSSDAATVFVTVDSVNDVPSIRCSGDIDRNTDSGLCSATVTTVASGTDVEDGALTATCTRSDGLPIDRPFPAGVTTVTCTVVDLAGDSAACSYTVSISDREAPAIIAPASISIGTDSSSCTATLSDAALGTVEARDACGQVMASRSGVPAGGIFPIGVTTITYTARDAAGNEASAEQTVLVRDETLPLVTASLTPDGTVHRTWGNFRADFTAEDACGLNKTMAVMAVPDEVRDFAVRFENGGPHTVVRIDLDRREISIAGKNDTEKAALLEQIVNDGGLRVGSGQTMRIDRDRQGRALEFRFEQGVMVRMQAPVPELRVTAIDAHGNVAVATATARF